jgi:ribonuclease E
MGKISRFGLLELSRQRLRPSLGESSYISCPRCHGTGHIRGTDSSALHILRIIQEEAMKENTAVLHAQVPVDVATYLLNEKRSEIHAIEARLKVNVVLIPNVHLETPNYNITRLRHDDVKLGEIQTSYQLVEKPAVEIVLPSASQETKSVRQQAAVRGITPSQPAPMREQMPQREREPEPASFLDKILGWFKQVGGEQKRAQPEQAAAGQQRLDRGTGRRDRVRPARPGRGERTGEAVNFPGQSREAVQGQRSDRNDSKPQAERLGPKKPQRPPREEKQARPDTRLLVEEQPGAEDLPQPQQGEEGGRRRRRGGRQRDRGDRQDRLSRETKNAPPRDSQDQQMASATAQPGKAGTEITRETAAMASAALPAHEADALSESKTMYPSGPANGQAAIQPGDPAMETPMEAADGAGSAAPSSGAVAGTVAEQEGRPDELYAIQQPLSVPIDPPLLLSNASGNIPKPGDEGVATESEGSSKTPEGTSPSMQQATGKPSYALEPLNLGESGLIMIETVPGKQAPDEQSTEESISEGRRKRKPASPRLVIPDEPLVQIETHK